MKPDEDVFYNDMAKKFIEDCIKFSRVNDKEFELADCSEAIGVILTNIVANHVWMVVGSGHGKLDEIEQLKEFCCTLFKCVTIKLMSGKENSKEKE